jgi:hypothetical protein
MKCADPARMSHSERLAEVAEILALGVQRLLADECKRSPKRQNSQVRLAVPTQVEAPWGSHALNPKSTTEPAA